MYKIAPVLILVILSACNSPDNANVQEAALRPSKNSDTFNQKIQVLMQDYYKLTEAFVNWDSTALPSAASALSNSLNNLPLPVKTDSASAMSYLVGAKTDLDAIGNDDLNITTRRHALNSLTDHLYEFLNIARYDRRKLYLQRCPMAFNDKDTAVWLSQSDSIRNPYLGLHHPRYKSGMVECGETKEVLNYTGTK